MPARFEIEKNVSGKFFWRLKSGNNETVAVSEAYESKQACQNGINSVKRDSSTAPIDDHTK